MASIRGRGNESTEVALAQAFRRHGITGWRRHQPLHGTPDFVFRAARVCVFVDGCFWHGCPAHCRTPKTSREYWTKKISGNARRDLETTERLKTSGWTVIRVWEHEDPELAARRIQEAISRARSEKP